MNVDFVTWNHKTRDGYKKKIKKPGGSRKFPRGNAGWRGKMSQLTGYEGNMVSSMSTAAPLVFISAANRPMVTGSSVSVKNANDLMTP